MTGRSHDILVDEHAVQRQLQRKSGHRRKETPAAREGICGTAREAERPTAPARTRKHWT